MTQPRCPYCLDDMLPDQAMVRCASCRTPHHKVCFDENQGCVSYGCMGDEETAAGLSIFAKAAITISHRASHHVELGPFMFGFKRLPAIPERRPSMSCPLPYARLGFESREVREGELLRGKGVIYVPESTPFKRIELAMFQGISRPVPLETVYLTDEEGRLFGSSPKLTAGSHPFYLQLRAPQNTPPVDPFLLELVLAQSMFKEVRSTRLPVFLLQHQPQSRGRAEPPPIPIRLATPRRSQRDDEPRQARDGRGRGNPWDAAPGPLAASAGGPPGRGPTRPLFPIAPPLDPWGAAVPSASPFGPPPADQVPSSDPFQRPPEQLPVSDPLASQDDPFQRPPEPAAPSESARHATARLGPGEVADDWREIRTRVTATDADAEPLLARWTSAADDGDDLDLSLPRLVESPELVARISGARGLRTLTLAIHSELVRPGGSGSIAWECFPQLIEATLIGDGGLPASTQGALEVQLKIPADHVWSLAQARQTLAHNAALRLRLALDGTEGRGDRVRGPTRSTTYTGA